MNIDKDALRKAAEAATKGQWVVKLASDGCGEVGILAGGGVIAECFHEIREKHEHAYQECRANGDYIAAANPATVIALLDEIAALVSSCKRMVKIAGDHNACLPMGDGYAVEFKAAMADIRAALAAVGAA